LLAGAVGHNAVSENNAWQRMVYVARLAAADALSNHPERAHRIAMRSACKISAKSIRTYKNMKTVTCPYWRRTRRDFRHEHPGWEIEGRVEHDGIVWLNP